MLSVVTRASGVGGTAEATDLLLAWSGGKDSALALQALRADPAWRVVALVTTMTRDYDRISIHGVRRAVLEAQVGAVGLPLIEASIPAAASNQVYEAAFAEALILARGRWPELRHIAFGDLFLADVRAYREALLARLGWSGVFPLWGLDTAALARRFVADGYRAILTLRRYHAAGCGVRRPTVRRRPARPDARDRGPLR